MGKAFSLISPETGLLVNEELLLVFRSFCLGVFGGLFIFVKSEFAKAVRPGKLFMFTLDFMTPVVLSGALFLFCLKYNFGIIRWYTAAFSALGMYFFYIVFYHPLEKAFDFLTGAFFCVIKTFKRLAACLKP